MLTRGEQRSVERSLLADRGEWFSLSPGERVGVRADVNLTTRLLTYLPIEPELRNGNGERTRPAQTIVSAF